MNPPEMWLKCEKIAGKTKTLTLWPLICPAAGRKNAANPCGAKESML